MGGDLALDRFEGGTVEGLEGDGEAGEELLLELCEGGFGGDGEDAAGTVAGDEF